MAVMPAHTSILPALGYSGKVEAWKPLSDLYVFARLMEAAALTVKRSHNPMLQPYFVAVVLSVGLCPVFDAFVSLCMVA